MSQASHNQGSIDVGGLQIALQRIAPQRIVELRHRVLRADLPRESAIFHGDDDPASFHFAAIAGESPDPVICCATFHPDQWHGQPAWRLRGMATDPAFQGKGIGHALLNFAEATLLRERPAIRILWCNARVPAVRFYQSLNWQIVSPQFDVPTAGPHHVMVKHLAAPLEVHASPTGRGVFATAPIPAGTMLIHYTGPLLRYAQTTPQTLALQIGPDLYMGESGGPDDFVNHSCDPNAGIIINGTDVRLLALRDIAPGEQITFDYSTTMDEDDFEFDCRCGSPQCRGRIRDFKHLPPDIKAKYIALGVVPTYNQRYME